MTAGLPGWHSSFDPLPGCMGQIPKSGFQSSVYIRLYDLPPNVKDFYLGNILKIYNNFVLLYFFKLWKKCGLFWMGADFDFFMGEQITGFFLIFWISRNPISVFSHSLIDTAFTLGIFQMKLLWMKNPELKFWESRMILDQDGDIWMRQVFWYLTFSFWFQSQNNSAYQLSVNVTGIVFWNFRKSIRTLFFDKTAQSDPKLLTIHCLHSDIKTADRNSLSLINRTLKEVLLKKN